MRVVSMPVQDVISDIQGVAGNVSRWVAQAMELVPQHPLVPASLTKRMSNTSYTIERTVSAITTRLRRCADLACLGEHGLTLVRRQLASGVYWGGRLVRPFGTASQLDTICRELCGVLQAYCETYCGQEIWCGVRRTYLGGVGMISRVMGSFTCVRRGCFSPFSGADSITKDTSPLAVPCKPPSPRLTTRLIIRFWVCHVHIHRFAIMALLGHGYGGQ